jgi:predicted acetyltransferase
MPEQDLIIEVKASNRLSRKDLDEIVSLCSRAYDEPYQPYLQTFSEPVHIMARIAGVLVSHALWITRWMQVEGGQLLKTAYVEAVATEEDQRGKGYASAVMTSLAEQIQGYDIGGLSPAETSLYSRLGWEYWQGPLYVRKEGQWLLVPEESAMILRTANTPPFDIHAPLSIEWREGEIW